MRFSAIFLVLGLAAACHSEVEPLGVASGLPDVLTANGFEQSMGWGSADATSLTTARAHGGRWSVRVSPAVPYGLTYARTLGELSATPLTHLVLDAWVFREAAGSTARLVVQVTASPSDPTKVFYVAIPVADGAPEPGRWARLRVPLTLPTSASGANLLKLYLWNGDGTSATYLDDVTLRKAD